MKNATKLIMCLGFFCSTNFGMQKEGSLYVEYNNSHGIVYRGIGKNGCDYDIDDTTLNILKVSNRFKSGDLIQSKDWKYCVQGRSDYASHIAVRRGVGANDTPLSLNNSDFLVSLNLTEEQLKRVVKLRDEKRTVFVTGQYNSRLDIESISFDTQGLREQLRVEFAKKQEADRLQWQKNADEWQKNENERSRRYEDERRKRYDAYNEASCCICCLCPITLSLLLLAGYCHTNKC